MIGAEGSEHVPPTLEREPQSESTNSQTTSRMEGDNCNPEGLSFEGDNDELNAGGYGDWKELQVEHGEQSATSTVKGDPNEFEGDYDNFLHLSFSLMAVRVQRVLISIQMMFPQSQISTITRNLRTTYSSPMSKRE